MPNKHEGAVVWREIIGGLEGVTPGPWEVYYSEQGSGPDTYLVALLQQKDDEHIFGIVDEEPDSSADVPSPNLEYIARLSPANIRKVNEWIAELEATVQSMGVSAYAAINPANWQTGDISDAARLAHYEKTLNEIADKNEHINVLEDTFRETYARIAELKARLLDLANAADEVGVNYFDTDTMEIDVENMQRATLAARTALNKSGEEG